MPSDQDVSPRVGGAADRLATLPIPALLAAAVIVGLVGLAGVVLGERGSSPGPVGMTLALALSFTPLSVFVVRRAPGHRLGRLMLLCGTSAAVAVLAVCWSAQLAAAWLSQWAWFVPLALVPQMLLIFPDGHRPPGRWRWLQVLLAGSGALTVVCLATAAVQAPRTLLSAVGSTPAAPVLFLVRLALASIVIMVIGTLLVAVTLILRWRHAVGLQRRQLACLLPAAVLLAVGLALDAYFDLPPAWIAAVVALPIGLTVAIIQYQLYDLDLFIHRGVVWIVLTVVAISVYAGVAALVGALVADGSVVPTVVAGAAVAALLLPAVRLVQRGVSRMLYGSRGDPFAVLSRVGRHSASVQDPLEVLPRFVATVSEQLHVPYTAIILTSNRDDEVLTVEHGRPTASSTRFDLVAHGQLIGELVVGARRPGERLSAGEARLLYELAGQAAVAGAACRSALEIQRSRERLVFAREEERRRLRRDLHDGVASALVGARMLAAAARRGLAGDAPSGELLDRLGADLDSCTHEVRDLIDGLRPAALDAGLPAAIQDLLDRLPDDDLDRTLDRDGDLVHLPAAVEVVAYRVVAEAVTNIVKHAGATACVVRLTRTDHALTITVSDNGQGLAVDAPTSGVGLGSMASRLEEVGGQLVITTDSHGTRLTATVPVATMNATQNPTGPTD